MTRPLIPHLPILKRPFYKINTIALKFMKFFDFSSHFSYNDSMLQSGPQTALMTAYPNGY